MRVPFGVVIASLALVAAAQAQSSTADRSPDSAAAAPAAGAAVPVPTGKRLACRTASQGFKGQDQRDQMQLCMAQARLDCLRQAIDQKIVGPQRAEFVKTCTE